MIHHYKKEKGFTLAEILITLGVIGVVAALTMPSLISHYRKKALQTTLLKTYAELQQANLKLLADGVSLYETSNTVDRAKLIMGQFQGKTAVDGDNNWDASNQRLKELYGGKISEINRISIATPKN